VNRAAGKGEDPKTKRTGETTQVVGLEIDKTMSWPHGAANNQAKIPQKPSG
jgi:hypothetical protein